MVCIGSSGSKLTYRPYLVSANPFFFCFLRRGGGGGGQMLGWKGNVRLFCSILSCPLQIVQSIGNLTPGGVQGKEPWMVVLTPLITQKITDVKKFLDSLVDVGDFSGQCGSQTVEVA